MNKHIASSWAQVFESDVFTSFKTSTKAAIDKILKDVERSAPPGLKDRTKSQGLVCQEEVDIVLQKTFQLVQKTMKNEQRTISRLISHVIQMTSSNISD